MRYHTFLNGVAWEIFASETRCAHWIGVSRVDRSRNVASEGVDTKTNPSWVSMFQTKAEKKRREDNEGIQIPTLKYS